MKKYMRVMYGTKSHASGFEEMKKSISKIKTYPKDIAIYPGHGNSTTLNHEIKHNLYF